MDILNVRSPFKDNILYQSIKNLDKLNQELTSQAVLIPNDPDMSYIYALPILKVLLPDYSTTDGFRTKCRF